MLSYQDIPFWTNLSRINTLQQFEQRLSHYFALHAQLADLPEKRQAISQELTSSRKKINESAHRVLDILQSAQVDPLHCNGRSINLITHVFQLEQNGLCPQDAYDLLHRGIGVYKHNQFQACLRAINPFFYVWCCLSLIGDVLFASLGVDRGLRHGFLPKFMQGLLTFLITVITVCSAGLSIADHLGYTPDLDGFLHTKGKRILHHYHIQHYHLPDWLQY